jgi:hypothetical protein
MKEILMNDLIDNIKGYKLLFNNESEENLIEFEDDETIEELAVSLVSENKEKTVIFIIDKKRKYITWFFFDEEENDIVSYKNKKAFKDDDDIIDNLNEFVTNVLEDLKPKCVGIFQELTGNKCESLKLIENPTDEEFWNALLSKDIRCRYCQELMDKENGLSCKNGDGYKEDHWYVTFKNGHIMNLWDYFDMNINSEEMSRYKAIKVLNYELQDR